jgi:prepilin-type processing-associated H-X9-DG protein
MAIVFSCACGQEMQAKDEHAGRRTRCPQCGKDVVIPGIQAEAAPESPRPPEGVAARRPQQERFSREDEEWEERPRRRRSSGSGIGAGWIVLIVLGVLGVLGLLCMVPALLLIPAVQRVREAAARIQDQNNLKQLSLAMINYADSHQGEMPPAVVYDKDGKPLYSWRVVILPYVEQQQLFNQFHLDEPWDSPHNKPLLAQMPKVFQSPAANPPDPYSTYYQVFDGPGAAFNSDKGAGLKPFDPTGGGMFGQPGGQKPGLALRRSANVIRFPASFTDGTSNTVLIVEAGDPVPWTKPADLPFNPNGPLPKLGGVHGGNFNAAMGDGSVRYVSKGVSEKTVRAAITIAGGEMLGPDW